MKDFEDLSQETMPCSECRAGTLKPRHVTYYTWIGSELISVPQFPAWVCDVCGRREYDSKAINWLNMLLDPNAGKPTAPKRPKPARSRPQSGLTRSLRDI